MIYDKIIIGAGLYGLYSALFCARKGQKILVLEYDEKPFERATYINQARVHMGYHYPRSLATAIKSAHYFERFNEDFHFCILDEFEQIYATSSSFSWTNEAQFQKFCKDAGIYCRKVPVDEYFNNGMCDGAFLTKEYTYDAQILKEYFLSEIAKYSNVELRFNVRINKIRYRENWYDIEFLNCSDIVSSDYILNAAYASVNQVLNKVDNISPKELFNIKYELCEIILCNVSG